MDDRERQTFLELKNKMVDHSMRLKNVCFQKPLFIEYAPIFGGHHGQITAFMDGVICWRRLPRLCGALRASCMLQMQQHIAVLARKGRRAALTVEELKAVPQDARTYRTIGKA